MSLLTRNDSAASTVRLGLGSGFLAGMLWRFEEARLAPKSLHEIEYAAFSCSPAPFATMHVRSYTV